MISDSYFDADSKYLYSEKKSLVKVAKMGVFGLFGGQNLEYLLKQVFGQI